jgi:hypothetical protein
MNISIQEFVRDALLQIVKGVDEARDQTDISIAPSFVEGNLQKLGNSVHFDLSITISKDAKGGLKVANIVEVGGTASSMTLNRVSFDVPVWFQGRKTGKQ